ncbi:Two tm domain protein [Entamoeba marina]
MSSEPLDELYLSIPSEEINNPVNHVTTVKSTVSDVIDDTKSNTFQSLKYMTALFVVFVVHAAIGTALYNYVLFEMD